MNQWVATLCKMSAEPSRIVLGAISGTSMDGIDLALCRVHGASAETRVELLEWGSVKPDPELKKDFHEQAYKSDSTAADLMRLSARIGRWWCLAIERQLDHWKVRPEEIGLLASHGQTLFHHPDPEKPRGSGSSGTGFGPAHATWQAVDGDLLAHRLGILTVSDFRQSHIAAGLEGAPLAPLAESLLIASSEEDRILLNLGGIANFTVLKSGGDDLSIPLATDTGPANTLLDEAVKRLLPGRAYDENGAFARRGQVEPKLLDRLLSHPFFDRPPPKSTGQELFSWEWLYRNILDVAPGIRTEDLLATLVELTVRSVADQLPSGKSGNAAVVYVSGGGWYNRYMMERFRETLPNLSFLSTSELGLEPDAKEAILFAVLGNETVAGSGWKFDDGRRFTLGKISLPVQSGQ